MSFRKRLLAVLVVCLMAELVWYAGITKMTVKEQSRENTFFMNKDTLYLWYMDESLTDYLNSAAVEYNEKYNVRIIPRLTTGRDYLEELNDHSVSEEEMPDMYIVSNDSLEKAWLAGLASEIRDADSICTTENFPQTALDAVTYKDKLIAYPFYYETSVLLYNETYLKQHAENVIQAKKDAAEGEAAMEAIEAAETQEPESGGMQEEQTAENLDTESTAELQMQTEEIMQELLPENVDELLVFADSYDAPAELQSIFKWDVTDIFYSYFFSGKYMIVGGEAGDSTDNIDIYNLNTIDCLKVYQNLNQFFSIDTEEVEYADIIQEFMDGKILYTIATSDAIATLESAKAEGKFPYEYGVALVPNPSKELEGRSLSVTNAIVVNGFSEQKDHANSFANFLLNEYADSLYERTGKLSSCYNVEHENESFNVYMKEYEKSISIPKMIETSNFWVQLEIAYTNIWDGNGVNETLKTLSEQIKGQVSGEPVTEEYIEEPVEETTEEYPDEEMDEAS
ncbi:MAG: extracellular solute-binding protein [Lachnospiraceae bacterium]|nr:extracellular solute-binding protein [Lachnospiraceae bacterium]